MQIRNTNFLLNPTPWCYEFSLLVNSIEMNKVVQLKLKKDKPQEPVFSPKAYIEDEVGSSRNIQNQLVALKEEKRKMDEVLDKIKFLIQNYDNINNNLQDLQRTINENDILIERLRNAN